MTAAPVPEAAARLIAFYEGLGAADVARLAELYAADAYFRDPERAQLGNVFGSRGCPFKCAYCSSHTIWTRKVRYRTPESVVAEI